MISFSPMAKVTGTPANCTKILKKVGVKDYEIGKTKVSWRVCHPNIDIFRKQEK